MQLVFVMDIGNVTLLFATKGNPETEEGVVQVPLCAAGSGALGEKGLGPVHRDARGTPVQSRHALAWPAGAPVARQQRSAVARRAPGPGRAARGRARVGHAQVSGHREIPLTDVGEESDDDEGAARPASPAPATTEDALERILDAVTALGARVSRVEQFRAPSPPPAMPAPSGTGVLPGVGRGVTHAQADELASIAGRKLVSFGALPRRAAEDPVDPAIPNKLPETEPSRANAPPGEVPDWAVGLIQTIARVKSAPRAPKMSGVQGRVAQAELDKQSIEAPDEVIFEFEAAVGRLSPQHWDMIQAQPTVASRLLSVCRETGGSPRTPNAECRHWTLRVRACVGKAAKRLRVSRPQACIRMRALATQAAAELAFRLAHPRQAKQGCAQGLGPWLRARVRAADLAPDPAEPEVVPAVPVVAAAAVGEAEQAAAGQVVAADAEEAVAADAVQAADQAADPAMLGLGADAEQAAAV